MKSNTINTDSLTHSRTKKLEYGNSVDPRILKFGILVEFGLQLMEKIEKMKLFLLQDLK